MDRFDWLELDAAKRPGVSSDQLVREVPHDGATFHRAAKRMRESGHFRAASNFYEKALGLDPHNYPAWVEWIDTLVRANQYEAADARSAYALNAFRKVRSLYAARGLVLLHRRHFEDALGHITVGLEGEGDIWYSQCIRAEFGLRSKSFGVQESLMWLERGTEAADSLWEAHFIGGTALLDAQLPALAAAHFAEAGHHHPRAPLSWLCLGDCFHELRLYEQALFYYRRVLELEPTHEIALERQRIAGPKLFGLLRAFRRNDLQARWDREYREMMDREQ